MRPILFLDIDFSCASASSADNELNSVSRYYFSTSTPTQSLISLPTKDPPLPSSERSFSPSSRNDRLLVQSLKRAISPPGRRVDQVAKRKEWSPELGDPEEELAWEKHSESRESNSSRTATSSGEGVVTRTRNSSQPIHREPFRFGTQTPKL